MSSVSLDSQFCYIELYVQPMTASYCLYYYGLVVSFETGKCESSKCFFLEIWLFWTLGILM